MDAPRYIIFGFCGLVFVWQIITGLAALLAPAFILKIAEKHPVIYRASFVSVLLVLPILLFIWFWGSGMVNLSLYSRGKTVPFFCAADSFWELLLFWILIFITSIVIQNVQKVLKGSINLALYATLAIGTPLYFCLLSFLCPSL